MDIRKGDLVDFGAYGRLYVCGLNGLSDNTYWVTDREDHRLKSSSPGWSIKKSFALQVVERAVK